MDEQPIADGTLPAGAEQAGMSPTTFQATRLDQQRVVLGPPAEPVRVQIGPLDV